jgi:RNA polymerase sigma factor (sigma-70 family)
MVTKMLIEGCIKDDAKSQQLMFDLLAPKLFSVCLRYARHRMEAEDILQDSFIKIFNQLEKYSEIGNFEGWARKIVVNTALNYCKKMSFSKEDIGLPLVDSASFSANILDTLSEQELFQLITELPDGYRIIFNLFVIEGYDHKEIATLLNIQESSSRSQLTRAKQLLQSKILKQSPELSFYKKPKLFTI